MSSALTYIVLGYVIGSQPAPPNLLPIAQGPFQAQAASRNYTYTPGIGAHRVHSGLATWNTARRICEEQGSHLAIINSVAEAEAIGQLLNAAGTSYGYVGVHDRYQEDEFVTIHGESLSQAGYDVWRKGEPNDAGGNEDCVLVSTEGKLVDVDCNQRYNFICELPYVQSYVLQVPVQPRLRPASGLVVNPEYLYALLAPSLVRAETTTQVSNFTHTPGIGTHRVHPGLATWNSARRICEEQGSHLVILNSLAEAKAIGQLLTKSGGLYAWIGAHDLYQEDEFVTIHGQSLAQTGYVGWENGEPNNGNGNEHCVIVHPDGKISDVSCEHRHSVICEIPEVQLGTAPATEIVANPGIA